MDNGMVALGSLAARQQGVVHRSQALSLGLTSRQLDHAVTEGLLRPLHTGVYRHVAAPLTWEARVRAAVLAAGPDAVASHRTAARFHGLRGIPRHRPEITVPREYRSNRTSVHCHRTNRLDDVDITSVAGVPCTTVGRTLLDLGAVVPLELVHTAIQDAVIRRLVSELDLVAVVDRLGRRGRRGTAALRSALRGSVPDARIESLLELRLYELIRHHRPTLQHPLTCNDGRVVRLDFALPHRRITIEAEGLRWHGTAQALRATMARARSIRASGWELYAYGWADVHETPHAVREEVDQIVAAAG